MKKVIIGCFLLIVVIVTYIYLNNKSVLNEAFEQEVMSQQKYKLTLLDKSVRTEMYVKPEWIPQKEDEEFVIQEVVATIEGNDILLEQVLYRENDIYFSFTTKNNLHRNGGTLIANQIIEPNGGINSGNFMNELELYNTRGEAISIGQMGIGPKFDFSFGIDLIDASSIQQGFYIKNAQYMLYRYKKK